MAGEEEELTTKIHKLIRERFNGDVQKGFDHYGKVDGQDSKIGSSALERLLADAHVGNWMTRSLWVDGVLNALDKDKDGAISWAEFVAILEDTPPTEPEQVRGPKDNSSHET